MSSRNNHTPSSRLAGSGSGSYASPLNALSNAALQNQPNSSTSNSVFANRLIPRDYLTSRPTASSDGNKASIYTSPLAAQAGSAEQQVARNGDHNSDNTAALQPRRLKSDSVSDKENANRTHNTDLERTRSLESVVTTASGASSTVSSKPTVATSVKSFHDNNMPRTSSIDSAISSLSASSAQRRETGDIHDPSPAEVQQMINSAESIEKLVLRLLKEKNSAANQNNQLWRLVEKQRALLLGLNKDLERISKERDKYKRRVKELQLQGSLPSAATQSPTREPLAPVHANAVKPPAVAQYDAEHYTTADAGSSVNSPIDASKPDIISPEGPVHATNTDLETKTSAANRSLEPQALGLSQNENALSEPTTMSEKSSKGFSARKTAPKPLNLLQKNGSETNVAPLLNASERALLSDEDEEPRGRRKTREDDDRDREKSLKQEQEARSKSKKASNPPPKSEDRATDSSANISTATPMPAPALAPPQIQNTTPGLNVPQPTSLRERLISLPLRSPGLPASPRPMIKNFLSGQPSAGLPMSPRAPPPGPLSPRAPKQHVPPPMMSPSPFTDPAVIQRQNAMARQTAQQSYQQADRLQVHEPTASNDIPTVYQGLVSPQYPNLLLPPNALPSIQVQVASSRLRPSRHSMLGLRTQEDSTVFSLSVYARASRNELWRIEKIPAGLPQLEQQLRPRCRDLPKMPDRKLFSGHSPVVVDARREAIDAYFEELLDMEMDEPSALIICRFLSTDVLDPTNEPPRLPGVNQESLPQMTLNGKVIKTGFLTKRGKNFGGWKSRYFILDGSELKYYDTPGGPQIGAIRVSHAKIGSQKADEAATPDSDDHYRHAFLIQEPKKKDSTVYVRHILCAESDQDRDQWVAALLHYVENDGQKEGESPTASSFSTATSKHVAPSIKDRVMETHSNTSSPTSPASLTDISTSDTASRTTNISGPMNGAPIQDGTQWGNKTVAPPSKEKTSKIDKIFHFKKTSEEQLGFKPSEQQGKPRVLRHNGYVRAVFGLPLADAVEFCAPFTIDVKLPAVIYRCVEYLRYRKASNEEGLFRLSGSNIVVKTLKERFNQEGDIDLCIDDELYDVHAVASLFKTYLRELPSPLLTRDLHIEFLKVLELESQEQKIAAYNILVHRLPAVNFELLRTLSAYLLEVTQNSGKNKMSIRNMGIVFSPTVNIPTPVFNLFLSEYEAIFEKTLENGQVQTLPIQQTELQVPSDLSPVDIRSPRHQMFSDIPTPAYHQTSFDVNSKADNKTAHKTTGSEEFGFTPIHPSYEHGLFVSKPHEPHIQAFTPPSPHEEQPSQVEGEEQFSSLNRILMPPGSSNDKRRKRESMMVL